jgi:hypothetical protein
MATLAVGAFASKSPAIARTPKLKPEIEISNKAMAEPPLLPIMVPTKGPLMVCVASGQQHISRKPTRVQCLADLSGKVSEVTTVTIPLNRSDVQQFVSAYTNNRPLSPQNIAKIARRFNTKDFIRDYPTLAFDANGLPCNGGHTGAGFLASELNSWEFVVQLGIDPLMGPRTDTNKGRDLIDQGYYVAAPVYDDIETKKEQRTFTSSVAAIFEQLAHTELLNTDMIPSDAKKEVLQEPQGVRLAELCNEPYCEIRDMLNRLSTEEGESDYLDLKRLVFYVPAIIFHLAGYKDWPEIIAVGSDMTKGDPLLKAHKHLSTYMREEARLPEYTTRKEQSRRRHAVSTILACGYAKATGNKLRLPLAQQVAREDKDGELEMVTPDYTRQQKTADSEFRLEVARYFMSRLPKLD